MSPISNPLLRIATRKSPLALWQAEFIRARLIALHPGLKVDLVPMSTRGDKILDTPLAKVGGKGLFVKELETALLNGEADLAVHSTKDVPMELPEGLSLDVICERASPFDALVLSQTLASSYDSQKANERPLAMIPLGALVGTSSLRRQCQLAYARPDLTFRSLRGNVNTRLRKLDEGEFDVIILAAAGLERLGFSDRIFSYADVDILLPAVGQGALSLELRADDRDTLSLLQPLHHEATAQCVYAERAMNRRLNGGCQVPIAGYATLDSGSLHIRGRVGSIDGERLLQSEQSVQLATDNVFGETENRYVEATEVGQKVAELLLDDGAEAILAQAYVLNGSN